jgi:hypothetical protein
MPTELLTMGPAWTLVTNRVYALPGKAVTLYTDSAGAAFEQSNVIDFATKSTVTLTGGAGRVTAAFLRATVGTPIVTLKSD